MTNKVEFKNTTGQVSLINIGRMNASDLVAGTPEVFSNDFDQYPNLSLIPLFGMLFPDGDINKKPYIYFRHNDIGKSMFRFGNIVELGDDFLSPQKGVLHAEDSAQGGTPFSVYQKVSDESKMYEFKSEDPLTEFRFCEDYFTVREGDFMSLKAERWPNTLYEHQSMYNNVSTVIQPSTYIGMLDGRKVVGLGEYDRIFIPAEINGFDGVAQDFGYFYINMMGIREDGRKEQALISIDNSGKNFVYYHLDGELPIVTDQVTMEADWYHLPYVEDGTCIYKDAVFRFCGKELHFSGKWGTKGFTIKPRVEKHGQSQVFGTWYEGETPYRHRLFMTFAENMDAYDYKLKEMGFNVVD